MITPLDPRLTPARTTSPRRASAGVVARALVALAVVLSPVGLAAPAAATTSSVGEVTAEPVAGLPSEGAVVTVRGTGFDTSAGIYVAVCVDNGPGTKPSPCIGGADTEGVGGATWISDNPPSYAQGLTLPYGPGGSFEVQLPVPMTDAVTGVDCRVVSCAVTVRYDHLRADDRGADHVLPVTFAEVDGTAAQDEAEAPAGDAEPTAEPTGEPAADEVTDEPTETVATEPDAVTPDDGASTAVVVAVVAGVLVLGALAFFAVRRRRAATDAGPTGTD